MRENGFTFHRTRFHSGVISTPCTIKSVSRATSPFPLSLSLSRVRTEKRSSQTETFSIPRFQFALHSSSNLQGYRGIKYSPDRIFNTRCNAISIKIYQVNKMWCFIGKVLATLALSMGTLSSGLAKGYTSPALDSILDNQPPHLYQSANNDTW